MFVLAQVEFTYICPRNAISGALKLEQVRVVLIDTRREIKGFTIFSIREVKGDLISLCQKQLFPLMRDGKLKMALF
jgi:hypothetical protein